MTLVNPKEGRSKVIKEDSNLKIVIPSKKKVFIITFLSFWLIMWFIGELEVLSALIFSNPPISAIFFFVFWLVIWTIGGAFFLFILGWNIAGKELIELSEGLLKTQRQIFMFNFSKEYILSEVKNFRFYNTSFMNFFTSYRGGLEFWGFGGGNIAFDYGMKTIKFAQSLDEAEANYLVDVIKEFTSRKDN
jgi:hypothetical protein